MRINMSRASRKAQSDHHPRSPVPHQAARHAFASNTAEYQRTHFGEVSVSRKFLPGLIAGRILVRRTQLRVNLELSVRPRPVEIVVTVNGNEKGRFLAEPGFAEYQLSAPVQFRQGANILAIEPKFEERGQILLLDRITFELAEP